ncbi:uncharacterized protein N7484_005656 [Penicillium longicatenatum]|uniref:uncharacterized protein n=1 Tax=Penicillium longicatenatum TaxID=1561947 RepID=UPI002547C3C3|nr:uncharacterized protein N7484_005656 [Penicillium longicatenatum]KAJ5643149.1 hypothetical protein N7484_005656 [Penicillium longicatenatum]
MGSTQFGNFKIATPADHPWVSQDFCRDSTLPVCNLFLVNQPPNKNFDGCALEGISLSGGRYLANLGMNCWDTIGLEWCVNSEYRIYSDRVHCHLGITLYAMEVGQEACRRRASIQLFLLGYIIIEICEVFTVGGLPIEDSVRKGFSAVHLGAITATCWILLLNAFVGFQLLDDGTAASIGLISASAIVLFIGTGYIALDTAFNWSGHFVANKDTYRNIALYVLYQLFPLVCLFVFFVLETILVLRVLGEYRPMLYLTGAALLFAIGQIFQYVISVHLCEASSHAINGTLFETFFTLLAVIGVWAFWSSITEDDWPLPVGSGYN